MKLRSRRAWAVLALLTAFLAGIAYLQRPEGAPAPVQNLEPLPTLPSAAPASAPVLTEKAEPPTPITQINPRFEICRHPQWSFRQAAELMTTSEAQRYLTRQTEDLRQAAITALLRDDADERQQVAGQLLLGDTARAAMAAASGIDARAYGAALRACRTGQTSTSAACAALSAERWAQLDPDNAAPWLVLLSEAQQRGDRAQAINAMHRAGLARVLDSGWGWLTQQVLAALPSDLPESGHVMLLTDLMGKDAAWLPAQFNGPTGYCRKEALADANTRQQCEVVAGLLMTRAPTLIEAAIGMSLGQRLGLPDERMPVTRAQIDAATNWRMTALESQLQRQSACEGTRAMIADLRDSARVGEWPALQAAMKAQPLSRP